MFLSCDKFADLLFFPSYFFSFISLMSKLFLLISEMDSTEKLWDL